MTYGCKYLLGKIKNAKTEKEYLDLYAFGKVMVKKQYLTPKEYKIAEKLIKNAIKTIDISK